MDRFNVAVKVVQNAGSFFGSAAWKRQKSARKRVIKTLSPVGTAGSNNCCEMKY